LWFTYVRNRKKNLQTVGKEALRMGIDGPWITKSYLEMILERKGMDLDAYLSVFSYSVNLVIFLVVWYSFFLYVVIGDDCCNRIILLCG